MSNYGRIKKPIEKVPDRILNAFLKREGIHFTKHGHPERNTNGEN